MAFRFSLSALLRLRSTLERVQEGRLMLLRQEAHLLQTSIDRTVAARRQLKLEPAPNLGGGALSQSLTGADYQFLSFQQAQIEWREQQLRQQLLEKQNQVQMQMAAFADARRKRQVLESLRDRELALYQQEANRKDQRLLDDMFLLQLILRRQASLRG